MITLSMDYLDTEILRTLNGSRLYGTNTETSDYDYVGVYIESPEIVFSQRCQAPVKLHNRGPEERNVDNGDDGQAYSLRHFLTLAANGNPNVLTILFARPEHIVLSTGWGNQLLENKHAFVSAQAGPKFAGYMRAQLLRLKGEKTGHIPNRPELVERYGYDTKYAMQVARLALQGEEYLINGVISLPMQRDNIEFLRNIREGFFTYDEVIAILEQLDTRLLEAIEKTELPEKPDYDLIWKLSQEIHQTYWSTNE